MELDKRGEKRQTSLSFFPSIQFLSKNADPPEWRQLGALSQEWFGRQRNVSDHQKGGFIWGVCFPHPLRGTGGGDNPSPRAFSYFFSYFLLDYCKQSRWIRKNFQCQGRWFHGNSSPKCRNSLDGSVAAAALTLNMIKRMLPNLFWEWICSREGFKPVDWKFGKLLGMINMISQNIFRN